MVRTGDWFCNQAEIAMTGAYVQITFNGPIEAFEIINATGGVFEVALSNSATTKVSETANAARSGWVPMTKIKPMSLWCKAPAGNYTLNVVPG